MTFPSKLTPEQRVLKRKVNEVLENHSYHNGDDWVITATTERTYAIAEEITLALTANTEPESEYTEYDVQLYTDKEIAKRVIKELVAKNGWAWLKVWLNRNTTQKQCPEPVHPGDRDYTEESKDQWQGKSEEKE